MSKPLVLMCCGVVAALFAAGVCAAEGDMPERRILFEEILSRRSDVDPTRLWEDFLLSGFELSSMAGHRHGYFEAFFVKPVDGDGHVDVPGEKKKARASRAVVDDDGTRRIVLIPDHEGRPAIVACNDTLMRVNTSGGWETSEGRSALEFAEQSSVRFSDSNDIPHERGFVRCHPAAYLSAQLNAVPDIRWAQDVRTLLATTESGSTAIVRFRTPNDQRRFGTILSEVALHLESSGDSFFRCFIVDRPSPLRLNIRDIDSLPRRLGARGSTTAGTNDWTGLNISIDTDPEVQSAHRFDDEIGFLHLDDSREVKQPDLPNRFVESLFAHILNVRAQPSRPLKVGHADGLVNSLTQELEIGYRLIERALARSTADGIVDDPNLLWVGLERSVQAHSAALLLGTTWSHVLESPNVATDAKVNLSMVIGEFGPPWQMNMHPSLSQMAPRLDVHNGPFLEAILHARWNWAPTDEELALCRGKLDNPFASELECEAAIDSLVRWGKLGDVPGEKLDEWFQRKLAASGTQRHCTWKALTRTESGRRFLTGRLESLASTPDIRKDVAKIFCARAEATLEMKRFDFMSEADCRQTLDVCRPLAE